MIRGTKLDTGNRFTSGSRERFDDGWESFAGEEPDPRTELIDDQSRSAFATNNSPDIPFTHSINPYRGCEHGCAYCYARPTHEYLGFNAGLDFESKIMVKRDAARLARQEMMRPRWTPTVVSISGVTDPYQPVERRLGITRQILETMLEFRNPIAIVTKNALVLRDLDLLVELASHRCAAVMLSITTLDVELARSLEPRTSIPPRRLEAVRRLAEAGVPVGVMMAPIIPGLTEHEIPSLLASVAEAGARWSYYTIVRLPLAVRPIFLDWLDHNQPGRAAKVRHALEGMRGGELNRSEFHTRMSGDGARAETIRSLFRINVARLGLNREPFPLDTSSFRRPAPGGQIGLFE